MLPFVSSVGASDLQEHCSLFTDTFQLVGLVHAEWESLDDYHLWQKEPSYKTFREFWTNFAHSPATGVPPLEMRHLNIPIAKMEHVLSKKFVEIAIEGEHHVDHDHQGKPHFNGKVIEGSGKGKSITLTGMDDPHEGWKALQANHEAVYKVALSQIA